MSKFFKPVSKIDLSGVRIDFANMTEAEFQAKVREFETAHTTHDENLAFVEYVEANSGARLSWHGSCSFEEYARRVRSGEDVTDAV